MNARVTVFSLFLAIGISLIAQPLRAQKIKGITNMPKTLSALVERSLANASGRPDVRLSIARLDHAALMDKPPQKRPHSSAFLFRTTYQGRPEVWAATARHVAQVGEELYLTFYNGKKEIPVRARLVQEGPALLSDAALIKLEEPIPAELQPLTLATKINPQEPLTTWGYASNKLYHIDNLTFEKDNTRFIRTDFPSEQKRRSGLCGGPLLNAQGEVLGIHCGTLIEDDKAYASNTSIIPYMLQAYYEGTAEVPVIAKQIIFGSIRIDEHIISIECRSADRRLLNHEDIYRQLPQSLIMSLYADPEVRYVRFVLGLSPYEKPVRALVYDKETRQHWFEPI